MRHISTILPFLLSIACGTSVSPSDGPPSTTFEPDSLPVACGGKAMCPVVVSARATSAGGFGLSVARGLGERSYVGFTTNIRGFHTRLWTLGAAGDSTLESDVVATANFRVHADRTGAPMLLGAGDNGRPGPLVLFERKDDAWVADTVTKRFAPTFSAKVADDGTVHVLWAGDDTRNIHVAKRTAPKSWTDASLDRTYPTDFDLDLDANGHLHAAYWLASTEDTMQKTLVTSVDNGSPTTIFTARENTYGLEHVQMAADTSNPMVAIDRPDGVHILLPASSPVRDVLIPATAKPTQSGCPAAEEILDSQRCRGTCTERGGGALARTLVRAPDGVAWLAYVYRYIDRVVSLQGGTSGVGYSCSKVTTTERSRSEVVIGRLDTQGTLDVRWRAPIGDGNEGSVAMDARGGRLRIATAILGSANDTDLRLLVLDTTKL